MIMFDELRSAIEAETWQRALVLALEAWREHRISALADLVDRVARRCPTDPPPRPNLQAWWLQHALVYDPIAATELCASAATRANKSDVTFEEIVARWPGNRVLQRLHAAVPGFVEPNFVGQAHRNRIDRLAAFSTWPVDPRIARVIASWFENAEVAWQYPYNKAAEAFYEICADELLRLRRPARGGDRPRRGSRGVRARDARTVGTAARPNDPAPKP